MKPILDFTSKEIIDLRWEVNKEEFDVNIKEGLIKSLPLGKAVNILKNKFPKWSFQYDKGDSVFTISIKDLDYRLEDMYSLFNNIGYYIAHMAIKGTDRNGNKFNRSIPYDKFDFDTYYTDYDIDLIILKCKAKYNQSVEGKPPILYHLAPERAWKNIRQIGLVPKSRSKKSFHPDLVFLSPKQEDVEKLGPAFYQTTGIKDWSVLKIRTVMVDYLHLYYDPDYKNKGYYTMNNIPPGAINRVKNIHITV